MHEYKAIKIVYEDESIIVVDKPSGILVTPDFKNQTPTLTDLINRELKDKGMQYRLYACHRLDRETSGLVIFSKGKNNRQLIMQEFKLRKVKKRYIALVQGRLSQDEGTIKSHVSSSCRHGDKNYRKSPKLAITKFKLIKAGKDFSVVEVWPITGRTNQIRIHFKQLNHPLLGERKYAFGKDFALKFRRLALHAADIAFFNPITQKKLNLSSDLPKDMRDFIISKLGDVELGGKEEDVYSYGSV